MTTDAERLMAQTLMDARWVARHYNAARKELERLSGVRKGVILALMELGLGPAAVGEIFGIGAPAVCNIVARMMEEAP